MAYYPEFAKLLSHYLTQADRSASWLARRLDVNPSTVTRWLNGESRPDAPENVIKIADVLQIYGDAERQKLLHSVGYGYQPAATAQHPASQPQDDRSASTQVEPPEQTARNGLHTAKVTSSLISTLGDQWFEWWSRGVETAPEWLALRLGNGWSGSTATIAPHTIAHTQIDFELAHCGEEGLDLARQRLLVSTAFGSYFAGLLERPRIHLLLPTQIDVPIIRGQPALPALARIFWALQQPRGPRVVIIAAEGGMGKSTLAAQIVRCLFQQQAIEMILGDSAKTHQVDSVTGEIGVTAPGYYDPLSCVQRLRQQLGLPALPEEATEQPQLAELTDRLVGRRAIIVLDNLETVRRGDDLLRLLHTLVSRDIRAIVTTRQINYAQLLTQRTLVIHLHPLTHEIDVRAFLAWHVTSYQDTHPALRTMDIDAISSEQIQHLVERTGGVPLLLQLVFSEIARSSWAYLGTMPQLFGSALLDFLYGERWAELSTLGEVGRLAQQLLIWVAREQYLGQLITFARLNAWASTERRSLWLMEALRTLYACFLIVNHEPTLGNFVIFPSLVEFIQRNDNSD